MFTEVMVAVLAVLVGAIAAILSHCSSVSNQTNRASIHGHKRVDGLGDQEHCMDPSMTQLPRDQTPHSDPKSSTNRPTLPHSVTTVELPLDVLATILGHLSWTDISKFASDILFEPFHSILLSDSFLLLLCQRDLYCRSFQELPPLPVPMQIHILSLLIARLHPNLCSQCTLQCGPLTNPRVSTIFCFQELIRMFVDEQCHQQRDRSLRPPLTEAMRTAFSHSKAIRIGWTKIILSHPQCVFWYFHRSPKEGRAESYRIYDRNQLHSMWDAWRDPFWEVRHCVEQFEQISNLDFMQNWTAQTDYLWICEETNDYWGYYGFAGHYLMFFANDFHGTGQCALCVGATKPMMSPCSLSLDDEGFMLFDQDTPLTTFRDLFRRPHLFTQRVCRQSPSPLNLDGSVSDDESEGKRDDDDDPIDPDDSESDYNYYFGYLYPPYTTAHTDYLRDLHELPEVFYPLTLLYPLFDRATRNMKIPFQGTTNMKWTFKEDNRGTWTATKTKRTIKDTRYLERTFRATRDLERTLFEQFQCKIQKYTRKLVRQFDDGDLQRNLKRFKILDNMRCHGKKENRRPSKVLKSAVERCLRRIINSILAPYLEHCHLCRGDTQKYILKTLIFLAKRRDEKGQREEKVIGNGKGMPSSWPCLFLVMGLEWTPVVYQFMKFDLDSDNNDVNERRLSRKLEKYGLTLNDVESEYVCNRLALRTDMVLID